MFNWFNNLKIRNKLIIVGLVMISLSLVISFIAFLNQTQMQTIVSKVINVDGRIAQLNLQSQIAMLMARRNEKDYLLRYKQLGFEQARAQYVAQVQTQILAISTYLLMVQ
ncbi:MAG: hypothetical protein DRR16_00155 [Candidatus Parabeggiatoa sp. nov. 3]|jgi:hypothetical protein|nr:MAG: hypothetical protein DRR00_00535 [Gammaproteobacteria bacterium]RKZ65473.1 MAG: hypothetical protein DRQ99_12590 [Gammaproteobacteria bacterium]RKZ90206.1 MAG: hypothetical protein DRR16_00155 [Gammaproteobacteria bacterium]